LLYLIISRIGSGSGPKTRCFLSRPTRPERQVDNRGPSPHHLVRWPTSPTTHHISVRWPTSPPSLNVSCSAPPPPSVGRSSAAMRPLGCPNRRPCEGAGRQDDMCYCLLLASCDGWAVELRFALSPPAYSRSARGMGGPGVRGKGRRRWAAAASAWCFLESGGHEQKRMGRGARSESGGSLFN